jgi:hypothetical protein
VLSAGEGGTGREDFGLCSGIFEVQVWKTFLGGLVWMVWFEGWNGEGVCLEGLRRRWGWGEAHDGFMGRKKFLNIIDSLRCAIERDR